MATLSVEQIEARLGQVACPICKSRKFWIDRRTMQQGSDWRAACIGCRYNFPVHVDMEFYERTQPDVPYFLKTVPCPQCQARGVELDFRIVLSVREAYYFVTCKACRHTFPERSSMEAFE